MSKVLFQLPTDVWRKANELFNKSEQEAREDVAKITDWMKTQYHLPEILGEYEIRNFLITNKYKIEKTKQKIDMYYTMRSIIPEVYDISNPKLANMQLFMENTICCVHPKLVDRFYRVYFFKPKSPNTFMLMEFGIQCSNIPEVRLHVDCMVGDILVFDMKHLTLSDVTKINPILLAKLTGIYEKVYSMRVQRAYLINSPGYVSKVLALLKIVIKAKIFNRIRVCQDESMLAEVYGEKDLPMDYGGKGPSLEELNELMKTTLQEFANRFDDLDNMRVNESLRPEKLRNEEGFGSFRKLDID